MVQALRVAKKEAEAARRQLMERGALDANFKLGRDDESVFLPILASAKSKLPKSLVKKIIDAPLIAQSGAPRSLDEALAGLLTPSERAKLVTSFDIVGDIAVLEIPPELIKHEKIIANSILSIYPRICVVVKKAAGTGGLFRIRPVHVLAGENRTRTIHTESGTRMAVDINQAYFTPRTGSERLRIAKMVKPGENVLVLFAGIGPYALIIEKHAKPAAIRAIELNPAAVELMRESIVLNKCTKIEAISGDVSEILLQPRFRGWAHRALMPHPTASLQFLPHVLPALREGAMLHYYVFAPSKNPVPAAWADVQKVAKMTGHRLTLHSGRVVRTYSPKMVQVVLDLEASRMPTQAKKSAKKIQKP